MLARKLVLVYVASTSLYSGSKFAYDDWTTFPRKPEPDVVSFKNSTASVGRLSFCFASFTVGAVCGPFIVADLATRQVLAFVNL